jgi:hypothetical protein
MHHYFYLLPAADFHDHIRPALTASWQQHSFAPCRGLCASLLSRVRSFRADCAMTDEEHLIGAVACGASFDRISWKLVAGELLLYSATEIPILESSCDALSLLVGVADKVDTDRQQFSPIHQVHFGSRDLRFGGGFYRPERAGFNDIEDVHRLASYLDRLDPGSWKPDSLIGLPECASAAERAEELELICDWFPSLRAVYHDAGQHQQIIVCESL